MAISSPAAMHSRLDMVRFEGAPSSEPGAVRPERSFWTFALFVVFVALTGGGSRYDILSLPALRFVACVIAALVLFRGSTFDFGRVRAPLMLLGALAILMTVQLVPLPPYWWSHLPMRAPVATIDSIIGLEGIWRPITLSPAKTANSAMALAVPAAGLLLLANLPERQWRIVPWIFVLIGVANAVLAMLQLTAPNADILYLYDVTNPGDAVGLFANRNHTATFLAATLWIDICLLFSFWRGMKPTTRLGTAFAGGLMAGALLFNASRSGLVLLALVFLGGCILFLFASLGSGRKRREDRGRTVRVVAIAVAIAAVGGLALTLLSSRIPAIARMTDPSPIADLRSSLTPILFEMAARFQPLGTGFGAFEYAYRVIEPAGLVGPKYVNQAHNDWLQFVIEGGVGAVAILATGLFLLAAGALRAVRGESKAARRSALMTGGVIGIVAIASAVDYPLRTPFMMVFGVWASAVLLRREVPGYSLASLANRR